MVSRNTPTTLQTQVISNRTFDSLANGIRNVVANDFAVAVARSAISGYKSIRKFGGNPSVAASSTEDVWSAGGTYSGWLTSASAVRIQAGGNGADTSDGNGARKVVIQGLDENWADASEEVTTAGGSASSATTTTFIRVFRAYVSDVGTYTGANTGAVTIETTGGVVLASIEAGLGQTQMSMYTIPAGYNAYLRNCRAQVDGNKAMDMFMFQRENADDVTTPFTGKRLVDEFRQLIGEADRYYDSLSVFPAKTDLWFSAVNGAGNTGACTVSYDLVLIAT